jgi:2,4-dienoyl-CoA reductase-like NADH-dependent reductase (Old Yellow Enzyme family)/thioredoxin reductase
MAEMREKPRKRQEGQSGKGRHEKRKGEIMELTRRSFLTGAAVAGLAAAGTGLAGCSPAGNTGASGGTSGGSSTANSGDLLYTASINPQDYDYRQNTTDFKTLFSPLKIGPIEINTRIAKTAAGSAAYLAGPTDELLQYYVQIAKGGCELIWLENIPFFEDGLDFMTMTPMPVTKEGLDFAAKLVEECGKYGAKLGYQWAPFGMPIGDLPVEAVQASQDAGVKIATDLKAAGFVGIEMNAAGFNQGEQYLSRFHNTRTDEYGVGSLENRARWCTETIAKIKAAAGNDFIVQMLIDVIEENDNLTNDASLATPDNFVTEPHNKVTTIEDGIGFAKLFEAAGADSMHLRLGPLGNHPCQFGSDLYFILNGIEGATGYGTQWNFKRHWQGQIVGNHSGAGMLFDISARYKEAGVGIPVGIVTYMDPAHAPDYFEQALADGKADFYMINRPLTVDNEYINKLKEGRLDEIAPCTRCLHCHIGSNESNREFGYCRVNALTQRVMSGVPGTPDTYELPPLAGAAKNVMVIGGGPAGLEAAGVASARGHKVTLYEKSGSLGGQLTFASMVKGPHENLDDLKAYLERRLELNGVTVVLNQEVDAAFIESEAPDAVILAVGALRNEEAVKSDSIPVIQFEDFMGAEMGENIIIYGSNAQAFDSALWLTVHNKNVQIVTPNPNNELDKQQSQHAQRFITTALYSLGVKAWAGASIKSAADGKVTITTEAKTEIALPADAILNAADLLPNDSLIKGISVKETYAIGDCASPYNIALAIRGGNDAGRAL